MYNRPRHRLPQQIINANLQKGLPSKITDILSKQNHGNFYGDFFNEMEKALIEATLQYAGNNQTKAAHILGIERATLRKKLAFYGIHTSESAQGGLRYSRSSAISL